ncbi:MAG: NADH-quinone oxidoreductase subunit A, partial [Bdellovibrionales bacterium]|nr:NADH-quinone oxidoreductase subunit A [Bdellovibrionales bacterium]
LVFVENLKELGAPLLVSMGFFLIVLVYGLFYEWRAGGLEWD